MRYQFQYILFDQNVSSLFLKQFSVGDVTTSSDMEVHSSTIVNTLGVEHSPLINCVVSHFFNFIFAIFCYVVMPHD